MLKSLDVEGLKINLQNQIYHYYLTVSCDKETYIIIHLAFAHPLIICKAVYKNKIVDVLAIQCIMDVQAIQRIMDLDNAKKKTSSATKNSWYLEVKNAETDYQCHQKLFHHYSVWKKSAQLINSFLRYCRCQSHMN